MPESCNTVPHPNPHSADDSTESPLGSPQGSPLGRPKLGEGIIQNTVAFLPDYDRLCAIW
jgi:hypothetical protein